MDFTQLLTEFGFPVALVSFFIWQAWIREKRLADRVTNLEELVSGTVMSLVEKSTAAITKNTAVTVRLEKWLEKWLEKQTQSKLRL